MTRGQTRYTMSRAMRAFQGGKDYKPSKALKLLKKHQFKKSSSNATASGSPEEPVAPDAPPHDAPTLPRSNSDFNFEFETSETPVKDLV
jgi:hypothetical protein